jgi:hypothetical protein
MISYKTGVLFTYFQMSEITKEDQFVHVCKNVLNKKCYGAFSFFFYYYIFLIKIKIMSRILSQIKVLSSMRVLTLI